MIANIFVSGSILHDDLFEMTARLQEFARNMFKRIPDRMKNSVY